jgi:glycosyltransferase involved in cell wall biosynthesis
MRIFQLISSSGLYGAERVILTLCRELNRMGHETTIGVFENAHRPNTEILTVARSMKLPVQVIPCANRFDRTAIRVLQSVFEQSEPEVLHAHGYKADLYGYLAAKKSKATLVSTCHTWLDNDWRVYLYGVIDRFVLRRFQMIVAVSDDVAKRLREARVPENKIRIINNGIDIDAFSNAEPALRKGVPPTQRIVGLVGRLSPEKGIEYFLSAASKIKISHPQTTFVVVGEGPERNNLEATARKLGIQDSVRFTGKLDNMAEVYASLDVIVSSSLKEGLPLTILEALAAKLPVVATSVGAVPTVILHNQTGLLAPPRDADALASEIIRLLDNPELARALGIEGHKLVREHFSAQSMAAEYLKLYTDATADSAQLV